jgi:hypothetical protein
MFRELVDNVIYLTHSIPNLAFVVNVVSRFMQVLKESHLQVIKRISWYVKGHVLVWH